MRQLYYLSLMFEHNSELILLHQDKLPVHLQIFSFPASKFFYLKADINLYILQTKESVQKTIQQMLFYQASHYNKKYF